MKHFAMMILFAAMLFATSAAVAEEAANQQPTERSYAFRVGFKIGGVIAFPDGEATPRSMNVALGFSITNLTDLEWLVWTTEVGAVSIINVFNPAPYIFSGPVFIVVPKKFTLQLWGIYQLNPPYAANGGEVTNYVGGGATPAFIITKEITAAFPLGVGDTVDGPKQVPSASINFKLTFPLPF